FSVTQRSERPFSPLFAAAMGVLPKAQSQPVGRSASEEVRGRLETLLAQALERVIDESSIPAGGLMQVVLPSGEGQPWHPVPLDVNPPVKWFGQIEKSRREINHVGDGPTGDLLQSNELLQFWTAVRAIVRSLRDQWSVGAPGWLGRCTLRDIAQWQIEEYLRA